MFFDVRLIVRACTTYRTVIISAVLFSQFGIRKFGYVIYGSFPSIIFAVSTDLTIQSLFVISDINGVKRFLVYILSCSLSRNGLAIICSLSVNPVVCINRKVDIIVLEICLTVTICNICNRNSCKLLIGLSAVLRLLNDVLQVSYTRNFCRSFNGDIRTIATICKGAILCIISNFRSWHSCDTLLYGLTYHTYKQSPS